MAFRTPTVALSPRARLIIPVIAALVVLIIALVLFTSLYANLQFFREVHFSGVFTKVLVTRLLMFLVVGLIVSVIVCGNAVIAYQIRPPFRPASLEQQNLDRYRLAVQPRLRSLLVAFGAVLTIFAGLAGQGRWQTFLLWVNGKPFGHVDPQFHRDISYFVFTYPMQRFVLGIGFTSLIIALIASVLVHYLYGGIRLQTPGDKAVPAAKAHLSVLLGLFVLLKAFAYYLDRFGLNYSSRGFVQTGASYTDVHAVLSAKTILLVISIVCALLFFANIRLRGWALPGVSLGLLVLAAIIVGSLIPAIYQHFSVKPNELAKETPYIQRNINETRYAYGLSGVKASTYDATKAAPTVASSDAANTQNIRLLDPNQLSPTFDQLQQLRNYYSVPPTLDIDRYTVNGQLRDFVVAAREVNLNGLQANQQNWITEHLTYTHGNGLIAAPANQVNAQGQPVFSAGEQNVPPTGVLGLTQNGSRIYYGEQSPTYSIVNTKQPEEDGTGGEATTNTYSGAGGVKLSSIGRLLYAIHFRDANFVLSGAIDSNSRVQYFRNPRDRVQKVAPWLTLDGDPFPTVVNGRVTWVLDGYTTTNLFPYSARRTLGDVTADTLNTQAGSNNAQLAQNQVNYIRNSVKATVDAEDGTVHLYAWDPTDPMLKTWESVFPNTVQPRSDMPADLLQHVRYPEDLFKVQRDLLSQYHVTDPATFFKGDEFWSVPDDPSGGGEPQPPFYVVSQLPGQSAPTFNLTTTLVPQGGRRTLAAFLSVSSGPGTPGDPSSQYGAFTLLATPNGSSIDGVPQVQNNFNAFAPYSRDRTQFSSGGSHVIDGNLLAIPTGGGVLYVEPIYLTGSSSVNGTFPVLQKVLTSYNGTIGYDNTLAGALQQSFAGSPAVTTPPAGGGAGGSGSSATPTPSVSATATPSALPTGVADLATQLQAALADQQAAASAGAYAKAAADQAKVAALAAQLAKVVGAPSPSSSASASASTRAAPAASPSASASG